MDERMILVDGPVQAQGRLGGNNSSDGASDSSSDGSTEDLVTANSASGDELAELLELRPSRAMVQPPPRPRPQVVDLLADSDAHDDDDDAPPPTQQQQTEEEQTQEIGDSIGDGSAYDSLPLTAASSSSVVASGATSLTTAAAINITSSRPQQQQQQQVTSDGDLEPVRVVAAPSKRSRKRPHSAVANTTTVVYRAQATECTICYDACTISGRHRLVALKCGHVFGRKCIDRWVQERKTCPNCNVAVRKADVRPLFSDHVAVVDNSGVEGMKQMYDDEKSKRIQAETELSRAKLQLEILAKDVKRHADEALRWRNEFTGLQCRVASARFAHHQQQPVAATSTTSTASGSSNDCNSGGFVVPAAASASTTADTTETLESMESQAPQQTLAQTAAAAMAAATAAATETAARTAVAQAAPAAVTEPLLADVRTREVYRMTRQRAEDHVNALESMAPMTSQLIPAASTSAPTSTDAWGYREVYRVALQNARVFAIARSCGVVCVGAAFAPSQFGVLKLSAVDARHAARIPAHESPVRDVQISKAEDLAATVAFDGKLVVSSLAAQSVVLQIALPATRRQGWSCAFSDADPFALFCGFHDGRIAQYDMRRPAGDAVVQWFAAHERQPVHALRLFRRAGGVEQLAAATFNGVSLWRDCCAAGVPSRNSSDEHEQTPDAHAAVPSCCSLGAVQTRSAHVVASSRTLPQTPARHSVFDLTEPGPMLAPFYSEAVGHRTPPVLSRTAIWEAADGATIIAAGDDDSKNVLLWDASVNAVRHRVRPFAGNEVVIDLQHAVARGSWRSGRALFGALSSQQLVLYSSSRE